MTNKIRLNIVIQFFYQYQTRKYRHFYNDDDDEWLKVLDAFSIGGHGRSTY